MIHNEHFCGQRIIKVLHARKEVVLRIPKPELKKCAAGNWEDGNTGGSPDVRCGTPITAVPASLGN